jgi:uncharacterized protein DUF3455
MSALEREPRSLTNGWLHSVRAYAYPRGSGTTHGQRHFPLQWLSLSARSSGSGVLTGVTFVQRVNTVGGKAPSTGGTITGEETSVPYSVEYFFYR